MDLLYSKIFILNYLRTKNQKYPLFYKYIIYYSQIQDKQLINNFFSNSFIFEFWAFQNIILPLSISLINRYSPCFLSYNSIKRSLLYSSILL